jgi:hypothetical protein
MLPINNWHVTYSYVVISNVKCSRSIDVEFSVQEEPPEDGGSGVGFDSVLRARIGISRADDVAWDPQEKPKKV